MAEDKKKQEVILKDRNKTEIINQLHAARGDYLMGQVVTLCDVLINEIRMENDTVTALELPANQGKIEAFRELKNCIEKGLPGIPF